MLNVSKTASVHLDGTRNSNSVQIDANETKTCDRSANTEEIDVMQWMVSHQQARRNLTPGELIYANTMVADEIALENKEKMLEGTYKSHESRKNGCVQMDASKDNIRDRSTNTREQVAKLSGVGVGT